MSFHDLGLQEPILRAVLSEGYTSPTPVQRQAIPHLLAGRDVLGSAQTGTGKTAAFALPLLNRLHLSHEQSRSQQRVRPIRVLVLSPTRELASQITDSFHAYGRNTELRFAVIFGGVSQSPQAQALRRGVDVLIATPGRLCDLMNQGLVDLRNIETLVLDEADRMLDMGFLPDIRRVIAKLPSKRQTILFSATMPEAIERLASTLLRDPVHVRITPVKATTELIEQSVCFVNKADKVQLLVRLLTAQPIRGAIVFTRTKHGADRLTKRLRSAGIAAEAMHGDKTQAARERTLANFKASRTKILVATDVASRGIDVEGISHIVNYDLPMESETYVHRIGRTGRAGATGCAITLCSDDERAQLQGIERLIGKKLPVQKPQFLADAAASRPTIPSNHASNPPAGGPKPQHPATPQRTFGGASPSSKPRRPWGKKSQRFPRKSTGSSPAWGHDNADRRNNRQQMVGGSRG